MGLFDLGGIFDTPDQSHLDDPTSNPIGFSNKRVVDLGGQLGRLLGQKQKEGISSALDVLSSGGEIGPRAENAARAGIERDRQMLQQDIKQSAAQSGTSGFSGTGALQGLADAGATGAKNKSALRFAQERANRRRGDLGSIFGDLLLNPSLNLIAGRPGAAENTTPTGLKKLAGLGGQVFNMFSSLGGMKRPGGGGASAGQFNAGTADQFSDFGDAADYGYNPSEEFA